MDRLSEKHPRRLTDVSLAEDGTVLEQDGTPFNLGVIMSRGEPVLVALVSADQSKRAFGKVVPFPLTANQGACSVEAEQMLPGLAYELRGTGFESGEKVKLSCECKGKKKPQSDITSNDKGEWSTIVAFDPKEKLRHLKLLLKGRACEVPLELAIGNTALKYE